MTIEKLGSKLYSGTKVDRVSPSLGSDADGTNTGITLVDVNNYADFSGSSSYISTSGTQSDTDFQIGDSFSISLWFNTTSTSFGSIINRWGSQNGGGNNGWSLLDSGTAASFRFSSSWSSNAIRVNTSSDSAFSDGKWHHLVMTYNGTGHGGVIFYLDGAVKSSSADLTGSVGSITYSLGLALGAYSDGYSDNYDGAMKQVLIYSDVLSSSEVTTLYNSGTPVTSPSTSNLVAWYKLEANANDSQGSINGTTNNVSFISDAYKLGTGAYSLSGTNPLYFANAKDNKLLPETGDFTIACWVKHSGHSDHQQIFRSQDSSGSSKGEFRINHSGTSSQDDRLALALNDGTNGTGGNSATVMTTNAVPQNEWVHLACTRTGATVKLYINGILETNQNTSGTFSANMKWGNDTPRVGRMENANETLQGSIDDLAVWHRVLSATEIGKLVNNNVGGDSGWSKTSSNINIQNSRVDFDTTSSGSSTSALSYDIGTANISGTWVLRGKSVITNYTVGGDGSSCHLFVGFSDKDHTTAFDGNQDSISFAIGAGTNDDNYYIGSSDGGAMYSMTSHTNGQTTHEPTEETLYWELKRTGTTGVTLTLYTDSGYSTSPSGYSKSVTLSSEPTGLRYLVFKSRDRSVSGSDCIGYMDDLKFWDNTTTASGTPDNTFEFTAGDAQLVSSLTNKSELKAYYNMDTALPITDPTSQITTADTGQKITTGATQFRRLDLNDSAYGISGTTGLDSTWTIRCVFDTTAITLPSGNNYKTRMVALGLASDQVAVDANTDRIQWGYRIWDSNGGDEPDNIWGYDQRNSGHGFGIKKFTNNLVPSVSKYFIEVNRLTATSLKITIRTDSHTGDIVRQETFTGEASGVTDLRYLSFYEYFEGGTNNGTFTTIIGDVEIWNGSTTASGTADVTITGHNFGCNNEFSATSDLEALSGVRTSSIFQQVDDTPSYWWYNGTSWVLDGTTEKDLTSSSQTWTKVGTSIVKTDNTITATSATDTGSGSTGANRVYTTLPSTLSNTAHVTDFDLKITANASAGDPDIVPIMYTAGTGAFGAGSQDGYGFDMYSDSGSGNNYNMRLIARDGTDNDYSATITLIPQTQYYCRLVRNSADLGTLNVYSDSARTTHISGSPKTLTIASGSARGADCTHLQSSSWSQSGSTSYIVSNVKLQNGRSTWLE